MKKKLANSLLMGDAMDMMDMMDIGVPIEALYRDFNRDSDIHDIHDIHYSNQNLE